MNGTITGAVINGIEATQNYEPLQFWLGLTALLWTIYQQKFKQNKKWQ